MRSGVLLLLVLGTVPAWGQRCPGGQCDRTPTPTARPPDLVEGLDQLAIAEGPTPFLIAAYRLCGQAARRPGPHRAEALVCQGRAALLRGQPTVALHLAERALAERHHPAAATRLLLGDALRALGRCAAARAAYLRVLTDQPDHAAARAGLAACEGVALRPVRHALVVLQARAGRRLARRQRRASRLLPSEGLTGWARTLDRILGVRHV